jgi:hypothetical protein
LIFDFVADVRNLPKYLPTTKHAEPQQGERVRVQGEAAGHHYDSDGFMRADRHAYRLEWGADERYYSGYLQITPEGANAANVTVHLAFRGHPPGADPSDAPSRADINEGIMKSLQSIENQVTGTGGKEEPSVAT